MSNESWEKFPNAHTLWTDKNQTTRKSGMGVILDLDRLWDKYVYQTKSN